ncbi:hypothetical protein F0562_009335 [Nyssa sinensis]|uniref:Uncharacterized protein n=1 Tax=Nyssa sinensis TaxID=561372 RepID=A0A5J4ZZM8_9ASTE|nr:hypothetical protein F0562_009335 [Nyssa sinensis]
MATAILRSQHCLRSNRFDSETLASFSFRPRRNPNPSPDSLRPIRRKPRAVGFQDKGRDRKRDQDRALVPVTDPGFGDKDDLVLSSTDRLGPEPETVQKQIRVSDSKVVDGLYAGSSAFLASPPPSSLPFPAFFAKGKNNDMATSDLRRLLRLDLL